ncbi:unnamed protein product [marine sediment metagenome]|uniref:quinolinate synthase n=1 Tax=marine sediment metagenome TaxID=412755 RepID=X0YDW7_9ZZZZ
MSVKQIQEEILKLKKEQDVVILAHYYQPIEIQEIADHLGGSLGLSRIANKIDTDYIIFAGVDFMAETASILNQNKKVLIPNPESCCPMAAYLTPDKVKKFKANNPNLPVVVYVNSTAAVKAESDICCTSANAVNIVKRISSEFNTKAVLFGPDANLADYVEQKSGIKCIKMPEEGNCYVHSQLNINDMENDILELIKHISIKCSWVEFLSNFLFFRSFRFDTVGYFQFEVEHYKQDPSSKDSLNPLLIQQIPILVLDILKEYNYKPCK